MGYVFNPLLFSGFSNTGSGGGGGSASGAAGSVQFSDGVTFASDETELFWDNTGKLLGIGTNTPSEKLTVLVNNAYGLLHTNGTVEVGSFVDGGIGYYGTKSNHDLGFFVNNGSSAITLQVGSENVGIGTAVPGSRLEVKGSTSDNSASALNIQDSSNASKLFVQNDGLIGIGTATPVEAVTLLTANNYGYSHDNGTIKLSTYIDGTGGWLGTRTNHPLKFFVNDGNESLALNTDGTSTVYGNLLPNATNTLKLGDTGSDYSEIHGRFVTSDARLHLYGTTELFLEAEEDILLTSFGTGRKFQAVADVIEFGGFDSQTSLRLIGYNDPTNYIAFKAPDTVGGQFTWTLPASNGTSGQFLQTNGSGTLTWASASAPSGTANTIAYFNGSGVFSSSADLGYNETTDAVKIGSGTNYTAIGNKALANVDVTGTGTASASGHGSYIHGATIGTGVLSATAVGAYAGGDVANASTITASGTGAHALGQADNATLSATGAGALAFGRAANANITASGGGSLAGGFTATATGSIVASSFGSMAFGSQSNGTISAGNVGSFALGRVTSGGSINTSSTGEGSMVCGIAEPGTLRATAKGCHTHGSTNNSGAVIEATGQGVHAGGVAGAASARITGGGGTGIFVHGSVEVSSGVLESINNGGLAFGYVNTSSRNINGAGLASFCGGNPVTDRSTNTSARNAFSYGDGTQVSGQNATAFGLSNTAAAFASFVIGRYGNAAGTTTSWVATDPLFVLGNGTGTGATDYALRVMKNADIQVHRTITAGGTTGAQTIDKPSGTVNFAATETSLVVTNNLVTTSSIVLAVVRTDDATATIKNVVPAAGSFTINLGAAATAETSVGFIVLN